MFVADSLTVPTPAPSPLRRPRVACYNLKLEDLGGEKVHKLVKFAKKPPLPLPVPLPVPDFIFLTQALRLWGY